VQASARGTADLYLLDIGSGVTRRLTNCAAADARCQAPDWSPDGTRLIYERIELNEKLAAYDRNVPRAWLLNLRDLSTTPLLEDSQMLGGTPLWSPDGTHIAVFDRNLGAIAVYDINSGGRKLIQTVEGESGAYVYDSDGKRLIFPQLTTTLQGQFSSALALVDLNNPQGRIRVLSGPDVTVLEDKQPAWRPSTDQVAFTRRSLDSSGPLNAQVYTFDLKTGTSSPLIVNEQYFHGAISWSPAGDSLVMQRLHTTEANPEPGIWVYDTASRQTWQIARNGYLPRWLP
jgi:Tol biopolymer transport system component